MAGTVTVRQTGYGAGKPFDRAQGRQGRGGGTMGCSYQAECRECAARFMCDDGGGMFFHLLRCDQCGKTKSIEFDELGELRLRYLKGLSGPYCMASAEHDKEVREHASVEPISEDDYYRGVEAMVKPCRCGGKYTFDAPPRCPECRSIHLEETGEEPSIYYD
jgi:predicted Zn-ribbon and HTH transcriptional regulator